MPTSKESSDWMCLTTDLRIQSISAILLPLFVSTSLLQTKSGYGGGMQMVAGQGQQYLLGLGVYPYFFVVMVPRSSLVCRDGRYYRVSAHWMSCKDMLANASFSPVVETNLMVCIFQLAALCRHTSRSLHSSLQSTLLWSVILGFKCLPALF